jgi:prophage regulatory protein
MASAKTDKESLATLPATGYVRQAQLVPHIIPFSASTLWRKVKSGTFPAR